MSTAKSPREDGPRAELERLIDRFEAAWQSGEPPAIDDYLPIDQDQRQAVLVELVHVDLQRRLVLGEPARVEKYLTEHPELASDSQALLKLIAGEYGLRKKRGEAVQSDEYLRRFTQFGDRLQAVLEIDQATAASDNSVVETISFGPQSSDRASIDPYATTPGDYSNKVAASPDVEAAAIPNQTGDALAPKTIGRYQILATLGSGGFGTVFKAHDPDLKRDVAIKVPRRRAAGPTDDTAYLVEAQNLARLDHEGIVPVHDVGRTSDGLCFVVSKFIPGGDLAHRIRQSLPSHVESARIVAEVAEALHHAHRRGIVHRDIKPANILLTSDCRPLVADFGLALKDEDFGKDPGYMGTFAYMSPEQARKEAHLVDPRSDVYSLGVVLFELLTGKTPYRTQLRANLLHEIAELDVRPPRQLDETVSPELDRICVKALSKRPAERYSTALDLAQDLRRWIDKQLAKAKSDSTSDMAAATGRRANAHPTWKWSRIVSVCSAALAIVLLEYFWWNRSESGRQIDVIPAESTRQFVRTTIPQTEHDSPSMQTAAQIVQWVLSQGGTVAIAVAGESRTIAALSDLPHDPFEVTAISLAGSQQIRDEDLARVRSLKFLQSLALAGTRVSDSALEHLRGLPILELNLSDTQISDEGLRALQFCFTLHTLDLTGTRVTDAGMEYLSGNDALSYLLLQRTSVTGSGLTHLKALHNLRSLSLNFSNVSDAGLESLEELTDLTGLALWHTKVTDAGMAHLRKLKNLNFLTISETQVTAEGLAAIQDLKQLETLTLWGTKVSDAGMKTIMDLPNLVNLTLTNTPVTDSVLEGVERLTRLQYLDLMACNITDSGLAHLRGLLQLKQVRLSGTRATPQGVEALRAALPACLVVFEQTNASEMAR